MSVARLALAVWSVVESERCPAARCLMLSRSRVSASGCARRAGSELSATSAASGFAVSVAWFCAWAFNHPSCLHARGFVLRYRVLYTVRRLHRERAIHG